ncbi:MAG: hypothetical protein AAGG51_19460 [Cyanobacteria bacterium P01_G01_bin.54]
MVWLTLQTDLAAQDSFDLAPLPGPELTGDELETEESMGFPPPDIELTGDEPETEESTVFPPLDTEPTGDELETEEPVGASPVESRSAQPESAKAELVPEPVPKGSSFKFPQKYKPIPVPDAPALSQSLQLAKALRPLARQMAVGLPSRLDEAATVDWVADTGVWQPVLAPEQKLWLDVALVFDQSPSMAIWQKVSQELRRLLSRYGQFRDVRLWTLVDAGQGQIDLVAKNGRHHRRVS